MNPYHLIRGLLFRFDPEWIHRTVMAVADRTFGSPLGAMATPYFHVLDDRLTTEALGLRFPSPIGLAAGFDKNAEHIRALARFGFGHIEVGTVTGEPQPGNERPRMFRLPDDKALMNRMGFNNQGSQAMRARLDRMRHRPAIVGVNIGKTKVVPNERATSDYEKSFRRLWDYADYFVVNVSSPNTPGLRDLQSKGPLTELLSRLQDVNNELADRGHRRRALLVKIAPDLTASAIDDVLEVVDDCKLDGIVATNTTISREGLRTPGVSELGSGGVSGAPVRERALEVVGHIHRVSPGLTIIGVGGIFTADDALQMLRAGATLIQVWTGFIYEGPSIARRINRGLLDACELNDWARIHDARS